MLNEMYNRKHGIIDQVVFLQNIQNIFYSKQTLSFHRFTRIPEVFHCWCQQQDVSHAEPNQLNRHCHRSPSRTTLSPANSIITRCRTFKNTNRWTSCKRYLTSEVHQNGGLKWKTEDKRVKSETAPCYYKHSTGKRNYPNQQPIHCGKTSQQDSDRNHLAKQVHPIPNTRTHQIPNSMSSKHEWAITENSNITTPQRGSKQQSRWREGRKGFFSALFKDLTILQIYSKRFSSFVEGSQSLHRSSYERS